MEKESLRFVTDTGFISNALSKKLSLNEFFLLMYFDNVIDPVFDLTTISKYTKLSDEDIMMAFANLVDKKYISVTVCKNDSNKVLEKISLNGFYEIIKEENKIKEKEKEKDTIFSVFESEFGRTLSQMDYEIILAWLDKNFKEELILAALKEASYNGVANLRYIDKILFEWDKKGYKTPADVEKGKVKVVPKMLHEEDEKLLNFNWLDNDYYNE